MDIRYLVSALAIYALMGSVHARAQESLVTHKSLTPGIGLDLAQAAHGAGLPSGMMTALLYPKRRVLVGAGDGALMINSQELETARRMNLNLVVLIMEDQAYGVIPWKQAVDGFADWGLTFGNPDFVAYAAAYGARGRRVTTASGLAPALEEAFSAGGLHLIVVPIDYRSVTSFPTTCSCWIGYGGNQRI